MKARKLLLALCAFMIMGGNAAMAQEKTIPQEFEAENIFKLGNPNVAYQQYFIGQSYLNMQPQCCLPAVFYRPELFKHADHRARARGQRNL